MNPLYILLAIPFFFLLIGVELFFGWYKKKTLYRFNDSITNLCIGVGNQAFNLLFKAMLMGVYIWTFENYAFWHQAISWWSFGLAIIGFDFCFYWAHRWSHEVNFLWGAHVVHHSSEEYNLSVALRQSWWHNILAFAIFMPLPFLGFEPTVFFLAAGLHTIYQFWIHTRVIGKLHPAIELIFNTPSHHRVHHGRNPKYLDKNHAGVFIVWDRIFGTFMEEEEEPVYGLTSPINSWNPAWANLHYYAEMWGKAKQMIAWKDRLRMLWARPGWLPSELGGFQKAPEIDGNTIKKYDTSTSKPFQLYVLAQFSLVLLGLLAFMLNFDELTWGYRVILLGAILLSLVICGGIMENKRWVNIVEYLRLSLVLLSFDSLYYLHYPDWFISVLFPSLAIFVLFNVWFSLARLQRRRSFTA